MNPLLPRMPLADHSHSASQKHVCARKFCFAKCLKLFSKPMVEAWVFPSLSSHPDVAKFDVFAMGTKVKDALPFSLANIPMASLAPHSER